MAVSLLDLPTKLFVYGIGPALFPEDANGEEDSITPYIPAVLHVCRTLRSSLFPVFLKNTNFALYKMETRNEDNIGQQSIHDAPRFLDWIFCLDESPEELLRYLRKVSIYEINMGEINGWGDWPVRGIMEVNLPDDPQFPITYHLDMKPNGLESEVQSWYIDPKDENYKGGEPTEWRLQHNSTAEKVYVALGSMNFTRSTTGRTEAIEWRALVHALQDPRKLPHGFGRHKLIGLEDWREMSEEERKTVD